MPFVHEVVFSGKAVYIFATMADPMDALSNLSNSIEAKGGKVKGVLRVQEKLNKKAPQEEIRPQVEDWIAEIKSREINKKGKSLMAVITLRVQTSRRDELLDLTGKVQAAAAGSGVREGLCVVFVPHTTAGVTINEHADADVAWDILDSLNRQVPWRDNYRHGEGNSAAHIKASLMGSSVTVPIQEGRLALGTWQGIFFAEFDGPRKRQVFVTILASSP